MLAWILLVAGAVLGVLCDELWRLARKKYAERNPLDTDHHFVTVPSRLATPAEFESLECPDNVSVFEHVVNHKNGVWCGEVHIRLRIRNRSFGNIEISGLKFDVTDSEPFLAAVVLFATAGANENICFIVDLDDERPQADRVVMDSGTCHTLTPDYFGSGNTISLFPGETANIELICKVKSRCRTFTMDFDYLINGKPRIQSNVFGSPITITPFVSNAFQQRLLCKPGAHSLERIP